MNTEKSLRQLIEEANELVSEVCKRKERLSKLYTSICTTNFRYTVISENADILDKYSTEAKSEILDVCARALSAFSSDGYGRDGGVFFKEPVVEVMYDIKRIDPECWGVSKDIETLINKVVQTEKFEVYGYDKGIFKFKLI